MVVAALTTSLCFTSTAIGGLNTASPNYTAFPNHIASPNYSLSHSHSLSLQHSLRQPRSLPPPATYTRPWQPVMSITVHLRQLIYPVLKVLLTIDGNTGPSSCNSKLCSNSLNGHCLGIMVEACVNLQDLRWIRN